MDKKHNKPQADEKNPPEKKRRFRKVPENTECQNCGASLQGDYCHQCGQAAKEPRRLVIGLVQDVFVDTLAIDGKLARSIALLLWRPGLLSRRYLDGKRVHYSPPFRLYLFASVFFFFSAFWMIDVSDGSHLESDTTANPAAIDAARVEVGGAKKEVEAATGRTAPETILDTAEEPDEAPKEATSIDVLPTGVEVAEDADGVTKVTEEDDAQRPFRETKWADANYNGPDWLEPHVQRLYEAAQRVLDDPRLFVAEVRANVPRFLLLAPLIYGLTLTLLYFYRRKFFIYDHFIISLYMHAALYTYLLFALLFSRVPVIGGWLWFVPIAWGVLQPLVVLRQAYSSNWLSVWIKWFVSIVIYLITFAAIIMLGLSYSLYQS